MPRIKKVLSAIANGDSAVDEKDIPINFYTLEGECKKCGVSAYSLIITDFVHNRTKQSESIFRTTCTCCNSKEIYYAKQINL